MLAIDYKKSIARITLLSIATLGAYYAYWFCSLQSQINKQTKQGLKGHVHILLSVLTGGICAAFWHFAVGFYIAKCGGKNRWWLHGFIFSIAFIVTLMFCITFLRNAIGIPTAPWLSCLIGGLTMFTAMLTSMVVIQHQVNVASSIETSENLQ